MKVKIKHWHAVATWHWKTEGQADELCGICRVPFDGTCPNCKYPGDGCPLILGNGCSHNFHLHCILKWLEQNNSKGLCPMCRQVFTAKVIDGVGSKEELAELQELIDQHKTERETAGAEFEYAEEE
ncbi:hypothetical protein OXX80_005313 [Metschnikowia pulcherrima]|uniref:Anaphase-promoting complex subunit 11 n=1 Tax=Metschnikowia pulcherrima TaxID=27326 RepID=A0A8H7GY28_9ASCO|nr:hypothetical protein HF325_000687 [Metschnikowia pulcherrima]KAJ8143978.1 hypothetical protein OY671_002916 [Metschnikowia pulcherrima]